MYQALAPECIQAWKQGKLDWFGVDKAKALSYSIGIFIFRMAINERYIDKNNPGQLKKKLNALSEDYPKLIPYLTDLLYEDYRIRKTVHQVHENMIINRGSEVPQLAFKIHVSNDPKKKDDKEAQGAVVHNKLR